MVEGSLVRFEISTREIYYTRPRICRGGTRGGLPCDFSHDFTCLFSFSSSSSSSSSILYYYLLLLGGDRSRSVMHATYKYTYRDVS